MIHCFDKNYSTDNCMISIIPSENYDNSDAFVLDYLSYRSAPNYREMSYDEIREYISNYYRDVLSKLDPEEVMVDLRNTILVTDERTDSLAIRHIVAEWLNLLTEEPVYESGIEDGHLILLERPTFIKQMLEEAIKNSKNMRGLQSVRAIYLLEKAERLEEDGLIKEAACYRRASENAEIEYKGRPKIINYRQYRKYSRKK